MSMADFIKLPGDPVAGLPYLHFDATLHGMFVKGDKTCQQDMLDRTLNRVADVHFSALTSWVLLTALYVDRVTSGHSDYKDRGTLSESDVGFWTLTWGGRRGQRKRLRWFPSYLFVDGAGALIAGREVFGYPKFLGKPERSQDLKHDPTVKIWTSLFERFDPDARPKCEVLFSVERATPMEQQAAVDVENADWEATEASIASFLALELPADVEVVSLPFMRMPMVFLKQFRDIEHPDKACYQEVTHVSVASTKLHGMGPLKGKYDVVIQAADSHPFGKDLGLGVRTRAHLPIMVQHDFVVGPGAVI